MKDIESQEDAGNSGGKKRKKESRQRHYAFIVYEDSSPADWIERLKALHVEGLISPCHDKDVNPDGSAKKKHWHVLLTFQGLKSRAQIDEIREKTLGPDFNRAFEEVNSLRGYGRYLVHADNPEKAQYSRKDVTCLGGVDYDAVCALPSDDVAALAQIFEYIREKGIRYFSDFMLECSKSNQEWFSMLCTRKSFVVCAFIKSEAAKAKDEEKAAIMSSLAGAGVVTFKKGTDNESQD